VNTRYPRIRDTYAGAAVVRAVDVVDSVANSGSLVHLVLVQYLDVLEAALRDGLEAEDAPDSLLDRALEAAEQAVEAFGLLEPEPAHLLN
jgi:hypothetical protein